MDKDEMDVLCRCCPTTRMWKDREEIAKQRRPRQV